MQSREVFFVLRYNQVIPDHLYTSLAAAQTEAKQQNRRSAMRIVRVYRAVLTGIEVVQNATTPADTD